MHVNFSLHKVVVVFLSLLNRKILERKGSISNIVCSFAALVHFGRRASCLRGTASPRARWVRAVARKTTHSSNNSCNLNPIVRMPIFSIGSRDSGAAAHHWHRSLHFQKHPDLFYKKELLIFWSAGAVQETSFIPLLHLYALAVVPPACRVPLRQGLNRLG